MSVLSESNRLNKELSLFSVYTLATGATLSSGFFLLPSLAAELAGPAVVLSYLLAVLPLLPGILSKIELATAMPRAGGEYYYLDRSLGPLVGTVAGLGTWLGSDWRQILRSSQRISASRRRFSLQPGS